MLSRVADSLYWIGRYIERAENLSRLLDVNLQIMLDFQDFSDQAVKAHWDPILRAMGDVNAFYEHFDMATSESVTDWMTFRKENPNSIRACLASARENARMVRDQISTEMWSAINDIFLYLRATSARQVWRSGPSEFFERIRSTSHLFQGLTDATFARTEGSDFLLVGKYLERADKTTRILDLKYHILLPSPKDVGGAVDAVQWAAVLRSCSSLEAYHRVYVSDLAPWKIAEFLILSETFPRSIRFCISNLEQTLRRVSGNSFGSFSNRAEQLAGQLLSELNYSTVDEIFQRGLHEYLQSVQRRLVEVGQSIFETYMLSAPVRFEDDLVQEQQQQQQ